MNIADLLNNLKDENSARNLLQSLGILKTFTHCFKCNSERLNILSRERLRCFSCKTEWSLKRDSILYNSNLSYTQFIWILKFFSLGMTASVTANELSLNPKTVENFYNLFRQIIAGSPAPENEPLQGESHSYFVEQHENEISISTGRTKSSLAEFCFTRSRVPNKNAIYKLKLRRKLPLASPSNEWIYFWRFFRERMMTYRGTSAKYLFLYLKELAYRYNHQSSDLFQEIANLIRNLKVVNSGGERLFRTRLSEVDD